MDLERPFSTDVLYFVILSWLSLLQPLVSEDLIAEYQFLLQDSYDRIKQKSKCVVLVWLCLLHLLQLMKSKFFAQYLLDRRFPHIFVRKLKSRVVIVVEKKSRSASTCKMRSWRLKTAL